MCFQGFYINTVVGGGCLACNCFDPTVVPFTECDPQTGQCQCRAAGTGVGGLRCDQCLPGYFGLDATQGM